MHVLSLTGNSWPKNYTNVHNVRRTSILRMKQERDARILPANMIGDGIIQGREQKRLRLRFLMILIAIISLFTVLGWLRAVDVSSKVIYRLIHEDQPAIEVIHKAQAKELHQTTPVQVKSNPVKDSVSEIVRKMYILESSSGQNDPCVRDGKGFNGYGFIPGTCYKSHTEVTALVTAWVKNRYDMPLNKMLCGYNLGFASEHLTACMNKSADYPYYRDYLKY